MYLLYVVYFFFLLYAQNYLNVVISIEMFEILLKSPCLVGNFHYILFLFYLMNFRIYPNSVALISSTISSIQKYYYQPGRIL